LYAAQAISKNLAFINRATSFCTPWRVCEDAHVRLDPMSKELNSNAAHWIDDALPIPEFRSIESR
jgi:hypothetical protein